MGADRVGASHAPPPSHLSAAAAALREDPRARKTDGCSSLSAGEALTPGGLTVPQAIALGALHGPAELLPVSSSAHIGLLPWLLGWSYAALDGELRKSFEVALHAGAAVALLRDWGSRDGGGQHNCGDARQRLRFAALAALPPALAGALLERPVERRLGAPAQLAAGLLVGTALLLWADRRPGARRASEASRRDALALGAAQALALVPGISRAGAAWSAARARGFAPAAAWQLQRQAAPPVLAGAAALKGLRLARRGTPAGLRAPLAAGAASSLAATLAADALLARAPHPPARALARYRIALAALVAARALRPQRALRVRPGRARVRAASATATGKSRTIGA